MQAGIHPCEKLQHFISIKICAAAAALLRLCFCTGVGSEGRVNHPQETLHGEQERGRVCYIRTLRYKLCRNACSTFVSQDHLAGYPSQGRGGVSGCLGHIRAPSCSRVLKEVHTRHPVCHYFHRDPGVPLTHKQLVKTLVPKESPWKGCA